VTEVGSSGLTKLLISRENELGLRGSPRGGPSECRGCNQRGQRETCDKCLHDTFPCLGHRHGFVHERGGRLAVACSRPSPPETASGRCLFRPERVQSGMRGSFCAVRQRKALFCDGHHAVGEAKPGRHKRDMGPPGGVPSARKKPRREAGDGKRRIERKTSRPISKQGCRQEC
jgi:hypothetical protein